MHAAAVFPIIPPAPTSVAAIAQPVEQLICNETVQGSIPCGGTNFVLPCMGDSPPPRTANDAWSDRSRALAVRTATRKRLSARPCMRAEWKFDVPTADRLTESRWSLLQERGTRCGKGVSIVPRRTAATAMPPSITRRGARSGHEQRHAARPRATAPTGPALLYARRQSLRSSGKVPAPSMAQPSWAGCLGGGGADAFPLGPWGKIPFDIVAPWGHDSASFVRERPEGFPSGQRDQTVNLMAQPS